MICCHCKRPVNVTDLPPGSIAMHKLCGEKAHKEAWLHLQRSREAVPLEEFDDYRQMRQREAIASAVEEAVRLATVAVLQQAARLVEAETPRTITPQQLAGRIRRLGIHTVKKI